MSAFTKTQASGTGLALVSTFAPTLGFEVPYLLRLGGVVIGMVMLIWPAITFAWDYFQVRQTSLALKIFLACCVIPIVGIWGMAWWIIPAKIVTPAPPAAPPSPPKPAPTPTAPPKPKEPWVSGDDIEKQRKLGRTLLIYSPQELFSMYVAGQNINIFVNKWMKIMGPTATVPFAEKIQNKDYDRIDLHLDALNYLERGAVAAYFDPKKWGDELISVRPGEGIQAVCQFGDVKRKQIDPGYNAYLNTIVGYNCEAF